jgi:hypothetical protein
MATLATVSTDDTYNDDLEWILEKLADRAGAEFGLILRFGAGGGGALVLSSAPSQVPAHPELVDALHCAASGVGASTSIGTSPPSCTSWPGMTHR